MEKSKSLQSALSKYNDYDSQYWEKAYFDKYTAGYIVINKQRIEHANISKNEKAKFDKEFAMSKVFAQNGYRIEMLEEISRIPSPDIKINGVLADLKRISGHNNIIKYASKAINIQGADLLLFQFDKMDELVLGAIKALKQRKIQGMYFVTGKNEVFEF
jgi:hypothetical protein